MDHNDKRNALICVFAVFCVAIMAATALVCLTTDTTNVSDRYDADDDIGVKEATGECYDDDQVNGDKFWLNGLQYKVWTDKDGKDHVQVHDYKGWYREIYVPDTIEHKGKTYTVNEIYQWGLSSKACGSRFPYSVSIGPGIEKIASYGMSLQHCVAGGKHMRDFEIRDIEHSKLKTIGQEAFYQCDFTSIELPRSLEKINRSAFEDCKNLREVKLNSDSLVLDKKAFNCCRDLETINLEHVTSVGKDCFYACPIKDVNLSSIREINEDAFEKVYPNHIIIGKDLSYLGEHGFCLVLFDAMGHEIHKTHENLRGHEFVRGGPNGWLYQVA